MRDNWKRNIQNGNENSFSFTSNIPYCTRVDIEIQISQNESIQLEFKNITVMGYHNIKP